MNTKIEEKKDDKETNPLRILSSVWLEQGTHNPLVAGSKTEGSTSSVNSHILTDCQNVGFFMPTSYLNKYLGGASCHDHYHHNQESKTIISVCLLTASKLLSSWKNWHVNTSLKISGILLLCLFSSVTTGYSLEIDLARIQQIESSGNPLAVSKAGCRGLYQISDITRREFNNFLNEFVTPDDLFNPQINEQIADWYLHVRIPQMLKHFKKPLTVENVLISYNAGISYVTKGKPLPSETKNYLKKYNKMEGK